MGNQAGFGGASSPGFGTKVQVIGGMFMPTIQVSFTLTGTKNLCGIFSIKKYQHGK